MRVRSKNSYNSGTLKILIRCRNVSAALSSRAKRRKRRANRVAYAFYYYAVIDCC